ncbi:MAG: hypothetical protein KatS3mg059_1557 [Thermomicrobiales bacterium]|nr:MAG: hypothetical protein KatS3mg059_1557 [Thermomicrobiales bacterium]
MKSDYSREGIPPRTFNPDQPPPSLATCSCRALSVHIRRPGPRYPIAALQRQWTPTQHGTVATPRPILCQIGQHHIVCNSWALPLRTGACARIACAGVLENVRDDEAFVAELARVVRPGGHVELQVPFAGPLAWLDAFNLYHYLVEVSRRGSLPQETDEVGWRRHYALADLTNLLSPAFCVRKISLSRAGIGEGCRFVALVMFRWLLRRDDLYQRCLPFIRAIERTESALRLGRFSTVVTIVAERSYERTAVALRESGAATGTSTGLT